MAYEVTIRVIETYEDLVDIDAPDEKRAIAEAVLQAKSGIFSHFRKRVDRQIEASCDVVPGAA
jgi:hypothetical protein